MGVANSGLGDSANSGEGVAAMGVPPLGLAPEGVAALGVILSTSGL